MDAQQGRRESVWRAAVAGEEGAPTAPVTPDQEQRQWAELVERLSAEANRRGGTSYPGPVSVLLSPPRGHGESIEVSRWDEEAARISTGVFSRFLETWRGDEDTYVGIYDMVTAIMDGYAEEVIEAGRDGTWIGAYVVIAAPERGRLRESSRLIRAEGVEPDHVHTRRIQPWPRPVASPRR